MNNFLFTTKNRFFISSFSILFFFFLFNCKPKIEETPTPEKEHFIEFTISHTEGKNVPISDRDKTPPIAISLSKTSINEGLNIGSQVATLDTRDVSKNDVFTYKLVSGEGDDDNADFTIDGNKLKSAKIFDSKTKASFKIRVETTDFTGNKLEEKFVITINDISEAINYAYNSGTEYVESTVNDGSIDANQFITVTVDGILSFKGNDGNDISTTDYTVANVPTGLTMKVTKLSHKTAKITFTGNATADKDTSIETNSVENVTITFKDSAFNGSPDVSGITGKSKNDIAIKYIYEPPVFSYKYITGDSFYEVIPDDGTISHESEGAFYTLKINVKNAEFALNDSDLLIQGTHYVMKNIPDGLTPRAKFHKTDGFKDINIVILDFKGSKATNHTAADDVNNIEIEFLNAALKNSPDLTSVATKKKSDISIKYDKKIAYIEGYYTEDLGEPRATILERSGPYGDGETLGSHSIYLFKDTFVNSINNNDNLTLGTHYQIAGTIPNGLTLNLKKLSSSRVAMSFSGKATNHEASDTFSVSVKLLNDAVTSGDVSDMIGATDESLRIRVRFSDTNN